MKRILITTLIFSFILLICACGKQSDNKISKQDSLGKTQSVAANQSPSSSQNDKIGGALNNSVNTDYNTAVINLNIPGPALDPQKIKSFIPANIPGTNHSPISTGSMMGDNDKLFTTATCNYTFSKGGLVIAIQDFGRSENLSSQDKKYFTSLPSESGYETETVVTSDGKGFILWDSKARNGKMYFLLANRFIIKIEAYTLPPKAGDIVYYFNLINQQAMLKAATGK